MVSFGGNFNKYIGERFSLARRVSTGEGLSFDEVFANLFHEISRGAVPSNYSQIGLGKVNHISDQKLFDSFLQALESVGAPESGFHVDYAEGVSALGYSSDDERYEGIFFESVQSGKKLTGLFKERDRNKAFRGIVTLRDNFTGEYRSRFLRKE